MFNTRNKSGISAHPCIILHIMHKKFKSKEPDRIKEPEMQPANKEPEMTESNPEHETLIDKEIKYGDDEGVEAAKLLTSEDPCDMMQGEAGVSGEKMKYL